MIWYSIVVVVDFLVDVVAVRWKTADKDLEILLLRQQLRVLERQLGQRAFSGAVGQDPDLHAPNHPELAPRAGAS